MKRENPPEGEQSDPIQFDVKSLINRLAQVEAELVAATAGKVDAVVLTGGRSFLLGEAQQALLASEALLRAVFESTSEFIILVGLDWKIRYMNKAVPNFARGTEVGSDYLSLVLPEFREELRRVLERVVATGEVVTVEAPGRAPDNSNAYYQRRFAPVHMGGKLIGVVIVARDITEQKAAEAQLLVSDRMASVGTLAAGVAHEINNPLSAVIANIDMATQDVKALGARTAIPRGLTEELDDARTAADRVRVVVRDLKLFSRAEDDKREAVDVERVLESTLRMAWNEIRHRARLVKDYAPVPAVDANESRLGQVFLNLVINAAQAIPEGNAERNVIRIATSLASNQRVVVAISDSGPGIPPEVQKRLFTPFFTTKPIGAGTGLGLSICQRIISGLGGEITFESQVGKGTTFRVTLPVARLEERAPKTVAVSVPRAVRRGRVLVVDDDAVVGRVAKRVLAGEHDVTVVQKASDALEMFQRGERFDLVICDLMMPQITGMDVHAALVRLDPSQAERVIFLTGGAFTPRARQFLDSVSNHRIEKPFDIQGLRAIVNGLIH